MNDMPITACEYARERHQNLAKWRNLWTILVFSFGTAVVLFLVLSIFLFIRATWLPAALSTLGTIVTGVSSGWVISRRNEAVKEEEDAYKDVGQKCGGTQNADAVRAKLSLVGSIR